jgi:lipid-A-disaccharide synthase-like uncharacterized protein
VRPNVVWLVLGFFAQGLFAARFVVQWLRSEKAGRSVIPISFWYFSLAGSVLLFIYALHKGDVVFIAGQAAGSVIYLRNIHLIRRRHSETATA